jgi:TonB-linked SusC/RagA family outer membrane protein
MKRNLYLLTLFAAGICCYHPGYANRLPGSSAHAIAAFSIKGTVLDESGVALPGVTVTVKGTNIRTVTDQNGNYTITSPDQSGTLVFSYIGFESKEIAISAKAVVNAQLSGNKSSLNEVVVTGYGSQLKRDLTISASSLKASEIEKYNSPTFQTALQGQIPGLQMNESSGLPGAAVNVRIRGLSSVNGSSAPLYIIDGIPVIQGGGGDGDQAITNRGTGVETNPLTDMNPNDIASIEVLKDAAATAIYGARGGAGVILITTKRAQAGKTRFDMRLTSGFTRISKERALLNGPQLLAILDEAYRNTFNSVPANAGLPIPATPLTGIIGLDRGLADTTNVDHLHEALQTGMYQEANLSASSGTERTKFYISGLYRRSVATMRGADLNQYSMRLNIDHDLLAKVKIGGSVAPAYSYENRLGSGAVQALGGYGAAMTSNLPIYPTYNADGTFFNPWNNGVAFYNKKLYNNYQKRLNIIANAYLDAQLFKFLNFRTNVQRQDFNQTANEYTSGTLRLRTAGANAVSPFSDDQLARVQQENSYGYTNSLQSYFTFNKVFGRAHSINSVLGMSFSKSDLSFDAMYAENLPNDSQIYPSQAASVEASFQTGAPQNDPSASLGYFSRTNYNYKGKYFLSFVVNRDGSSRFGFNKKFGVFPAVSAGWAISEEKFLKNKTFISFLKLRASAGLTGSAQGISNTAFSGTYQSNVSYKNDAGSQPLQPSNLNLHWEKGTKFDAGIDMGFLGDRITSTFDYYNNKTTELLLSIPTTYSFGYGAPASVISYLENRGALTNSGFEFQITSNNLKGPFQWRTTFNVSHNVTQVVSLGGLTPDQLAAAGGNVLLIEGHNGPVFNVIEWMGVDPATGGELVKDKNNNVVLASTLNVQALADARKPQYDKSPAPKYYGGFGNNFSYRGFSLNVFFTYSYGNYIMDVGERVSSYVGNFSFANSGLTINVGNMPTSILNRWTTPGQVTDVPKLFYNDGTNDVLRSLNTSRFLSDASFIRLKNLDLAYTLPDRYVSRLKLHGLTFRVTGQNLLLFTKFKGLDPEAQTISSNYRERNLAYGLINNALPLSKTLTLGINVGF